MKKKSTVIISSVAIFALTGLFLGGFSSVKNGELMKIKTGLISQDPLNNGKLTFTSSALGHNKPLTVPGQGNLQWVYFGSAVKRNTTVSVYEDSKTGLNMAIKAPKNGPINWTGFFAMSNDDYSKVYHTVIEMPYRSISEGSFSAGMYIQTSVIYPYINYVACVAEVSEDGLKWVVESGTGNSTEVTERHLLWADKELLPPAKRDCTIVTDGVSNLKVYYDRKLAYSANNLSLQMPKPFNSYLEVQTTHSKQFLHGRFSNYSTNLDEEIKVINAPKGGYVVIKTKDNKSFSTVTDTEGIAHIHTAGYNSPFIGTIEVYDLSRHRVTSTLQPISISGGDVYSAVSMTPLQKWLNQ
jgi:hypothetical protein